MTPESHTMARIRLALNNALPSMRLFRNNVGVARHGNSTVVYGLAPGSSDLIGWTPLRIRPEHVGRTVAVFTAVEVKTSTGRPSKQQEHFLDVVEQAGGIAALARDPQDVLTAVEQYDGR